MRGKETYTKYRWARGRNPLTPPFCWQLFFILQDKWRANQYSDSNSRYSLWNLNIPPKIKHFLWSTQWSCLPTRMRLQTRGVSCPPFCSFCENNLEDEWHLFWMWSSQESLGNCWPLEYSPHEHARSTINKGSHLQTYRCSSRWS